MRPEQGPILLLLAWLILLGIAAPRPDRLPEPPVVKLVRSTAESPILRSGPGLHPWTLWVEPMGRGELTVECLPVYRGMLEVNREPPETLALLPGIGPSTARALVEHRLRHGPFRRPEDLLRVRGIGPVRLEQLRPYLGASPR